VKVELPRWPGAGDSGSPQGWSQNTSQLRLRDEELRGSQESTVGKKTKQNKLIFVTKISKGDSQ